MGRGGPRSSGEGALQWQGLTGGFLGTSSTSREFSGVLQGGFGKHAPGEALRGNCPAPLPAWDPGLGWAPTGARQRRGGLGGLFGTSIFKRQRRLKCLSPSSLSARPESLLSLRGFSHQSLLVPARGVKPGINISNYARSRRRRTGLRSAGVADQALRMSHASPGIFPANLPLISGGSAPTAG